MDLQNSFNILFFCTTCFIIFNYRAAIGIAKRANTPQQNTFFQSGLHRNLCNQHLRQIPTCSGRTQRSNQCRSCNSKIKLCNVIIQNGSASNHIIASLKPTLTMQQPCLNHHVSIQIVNL